MGLLRVSSTVFEFFANRQAGIHKTGDPKIRQNLEYDVLNEAWDLNRKITNWHVFRFESSGCAQYAHKVRGCKPP